MNRTAFAVSAFLFASAVFAQPSTRPASSTDSRTDAMLQDLLTPARPSAPVLQPDTSAPPMSDRATTVAPGAPQVNLTREGTFIVDRVGRLTRTADGQAELTFESDGQSLKDPPMLILPNLKLMQMESAVKNASRDLRFRATGQVTEYNSRNYILLEKVVVQQDQTETKSPVRGGR